LPASTLRDAVNSFSDALEAVLEEVSTVYNRGYKLQNQPYRSIYLKRTRKLQQQFFVLQRVSHSKSHWEVKKIEEYLRPILDLGSPIELKKKNLDLCGHLVKSLEKIGEAESEILLNTDPYEAFKLIRDIVGQCKNQLCVIDPWTDEKIFDLYFDKLPRKANIRVLTKHTKGKFTQVAKLFKQRNSNFEVRLLNTIHDRELIVDDRVWILGQSLKDAGSSGPLSIVELRNSESAKNLFNELWNTAQPLV